MNQKRSDYISWDEYFMSIAKLSAMRSKDPSTQVGACIVSNDNRILSIGYNGAPNGYSDENFPWGREGNNLETKYPYVCHAELNAILNYRGSKKDLEDAKIYVAGHRGMVGSAIVRELERMRKNYYTIWNKRSNLFV